MYKRLSYNNGFKFIMQPYGENTIVPIKDIKECIKAFEVLGYEKESIRIYVDIELNVLEPDDLKMDDKEFIHFREQTKYINDGMIEIKLVGQKTKVVLINNREVQINVDESYSINGVDTIPYYTRGIRKVVISLV